MPRKWTEANFENLDEMLAKARNISHGKDRYIEKWGTDGELAQISPRAMAADDMSSFLRKKRHNSLLSWDSTDAITIGSRTLKEDMRKRIMARIERRKKDMESRLESVYLEYMVELTNLYSELSNITHKHTQWVLERPDHYDSQLKKLETGIRIAYKRQVRRPYGFRKLEPDVFFEWEMDLIPDLPGCYMIANGTEWIYIGRSSQLKTRLANHEKVREYRRQEPEIVYSMVYVIIVESEPYAIPEVLEGKLISIFQPEVNKHGR